MRIPPEYKITPEIVELIAKIDANRMFFNSIPILPEIKNKIQRVSLLKSSLYSARIEGNPLTIDEIETSTDSQKKLEVFNILSGIRYIQTNKMQKEVVEKKDILELHRLVLKSLSESSGHLRNEMSAIFNQAGVAIYLPPPPSQIPDLLAKLITYINSDEEKFPLITALISHLIFEKIHPFIDGNGRTGRLMVLLVLVKKNWGFNLNIVLEEYLDNHKEEYYHFLDVGMKQPEDYLLFMLRAFWAQSEKIKSQIAIEMERKEQVILPPRQEEIYNIIVDHNMSSFDIIRRRFLNVPERTLRYDLKKLQEKNLIRKIGCTKGTYYNIVTDSNRN